MLIGYARVSKADGSQSQDLQRDALRDAGIDEAANPYHDFASSVRDDRPGLDSCFGALRKGDVLVVWKLDRLGRNLVTLYRYVGPLGAKAQQAATGYSQRSRIETQIGRWKSVIGPRLPIPQLLQADHGDSTRPEKS